ncbi:MAG: hypothetical protein IKC72_07615 [Clostridia bacterium]|nr:hypothetical protein [Clostridia bacterium]
MTYTISPSRARGTVKVPSSKSMAHRLLLLSAFSDGVSRLYGVSMCEDVKATLASLSALGIRYELEGETLTVWGKDIRECAPDAPLFVGASASTLRFLLPLMLLMKKEVTFQGDCALFRRPLSVYKELFGLYNCAFEIGGNSLRTDTSALVETPETFEVDATVSSQFITGLLLYLALAGGGRITLCGEAQSRPYIDLTLEALKHFSIHAYFEDKHTLHVPKGQKLVPATLTVEGDYSASAFLDALNLLGGEVTTDGLNPDSKQGDKRYLDYFPLLKEGAPVIDIADTPDLAPILMALASHFHGATLHSCARLKIKESDRGHAMAKELSKFGADIEVSENTIVIKKATLHAPRGILDGHSDHRIVMALSVLLTVYGGAISDVEAVTKSFPHFFDTLENLGVMVHR